MVNRDLGKMRKNYGLQQLNRSELAADPIEQFKKWFEEAKKSDIYEPNAMALATVDEKNRPCCRIVLLKGIDEGFIFYTNYLSRKGQHLGSNASAAATFWWDRLERQVRIEGAVEKVQPETSDAYFLSRPVGSQISAIASPQSQRVESYEQLLNLKKSVDEFKLVRPEYWGGYRIIPRRVEFWQGRENRLHDRFDYSKDQNSGAWCIQRLAP